jgi:hypothetical protein
MAWLPLAAVRPVAAAYGPTAYLVVLLAVMLLMLSLRSTMRRMEQRADAHAAEHATGARAYARALEKIYERNALPAVLWRRAIHASLVLALLLAMGSVTASSWAPTLLERSAPDEDWPLLVWLGARGGSAGGLGALADFRVSEGRLDEAVALYRAAAAVSPVPALELARLTTALADAGRCDEAAAVLEQLTAQTASAGLQLDVDRAAQAVTDCRDPTPPGR